MSRRALCSAGSLRLGSPASLLHRRAPTPRHPSRRASLPSLGGTAAIQRLEMSRSPKFLGDPHAYVLRFFDPGGTSGAGPPGPAVPRHRSSGVAFRAYCLVGFRDFDIPGPDSAAHTLAVHASWSRSPVCFLTTTQNSLRAGGPALAGRDCYPQGHVVPDWIATDDTNGGSDVTLGAGASGRCPPLTCSQR
jgi:hypothetical protein